MFGSTNPCGIAKRISDSASTLVKKGQGQCTGILCAQSSTGIIEVWDTSVDETTAGAVQILDDLTLVAGNPYALPFTFQKGLYIKKISGTYKATVFAD